MLPCQHTFCLSCLKQDARRKSSDHKNAPDYSCPSCEATSKIIDFDELPNNLHIDTVLEMIANQRKSLGEDDQQQLQRPLSRQVSDRELH